MKKWIIDHPYAVTSLVFLLVVYVGDQFLNWPEEYFAFLLLLYFIVTLGIRLDNISKQIGVTNDRLAKLSTDSDQVVERLDRIQSHLETLNQVLPSPSDPSENRDA